MRAVQLGIISMILALTPASGWAQAFESFDSGDVTAERGDTTYAVRARPISQVGEDAIRFSTAPALGGAATVIEIYRTQDGARGIVHFLAGHPDSRWRRMGQLQLYLREQEYSELAAAVDAELERSRTRPTLIVEENGDIVVCTDGPGYLTERRRNGTSSSLSGFCGNHPNRKIARLMMQMAGRRMGAYLPLMLPDEDE